MRFVQYYCDRHGLSHGQLQRRVYYLSTECGPNAMQRNVVQCDNVFRQDFDCEPLHSG